MTRMKVVVTFAVDAEHVGDDQEGYRDWQVRCENELISLTDNTETGLAIAHVGFEVIE